MKMKWDDVPPPKFENSHFYFLNESIPKWLYGFAWIRVRVCKV